MKYLSLAWVAFWIGFFGFFSVLVYEAYTHPSKQSPTLSAEEQCAKNNGVPQYNTWGTMTDCKVYLKK